MFLAPFFDSTPIILEPVAKIEVTVPQGNMGDISGDLAARRGRINDTQSIDGGKIKITAQAPLAERNDYSSRLKSPTGAEGEFIMTPFAYEQVPPEVQQQLIKEHKAS